MKLTITYDTLINALRIGIDKTYFSFGLAPAITDVSKINSYDKGFLAFETNKGEEYLDLIEVVNDFSFTEKKKQKINEALGAVNESEIKFRRN